MSKKNFNGAMPALITPFDEKGEVDEAKLTDFVKWLLPKVHGFYICGSYGSQPMLRADQCRQVAEIVMKVCQGSNAATMIHVGRTSTQETIELAKHAASLGCDAVAALTPYYYLHGLTGVHIINDHFKALVDAVGGDVPVFLYNNPKYTNYCVTSEQIGELARYGLSGMKDSSTSIQLCYDCISAAKGTDFTFLVGSQTMLYPCLGAGGKGCVSGMSNLFPGLVNAIFDAANAGDNAKAVALQQEANELRHMTGTGIPIPFYHAALKYRWDIDLGYPRRPFQLLDAAKEAKVKEAIDKYKHLS